MMRAQGNTVTWVPCQGYIKSSLTGSMICWQRGAIEAFVINSLPPDLLRSFVAVAQTKSFSRAAERVHLSQSTVSQQIRRLEDIVGKSLFERDTRTVTLTRDG